MTMNLRALAALAAFAATSEGAREYPLPDLRVPRPHGRSSAPRPRPARRSLRRFAYPSRADAEFMEAVRVGLLIGMPMGAVIYAAVREPWRDFVWWRLSLSLKPRCERDLECVIGRGHAGPCDLQRDE
jgi:hypothetical protein